MEILDHSSKFSFYTDGIPYEKDFKARATEEKPNKMHKYRRIPVTRTFEGLKVSRINCENVSGVKEISEYSYTPEKCGNPNASKRIVIDVPSGNRIRHSQLESRLSTKIIPAEFQSKHIFMERPVKISTSEPALAGGNDQGDSVLLEPNLICVDADETLSLSIGDAKSTPNGIEGFIYIKNNGNVFKSSIAAEKVASQDHDGSWITPGVHNENFKRISEQAENAKFGHTQNEQECDRTALNFLTREGGSFDVTIFLSSMQNSISNNFRKQNTVMDDTYFKKVQPDAKRAKKMGRYKREDKKPMPALGKSLESTYEKYVKSANLSTNMPDKRKHYRKQSPVNMRFIDNCGLKNDINKFKDSGFDVSSASGSESKYSYRLPDNFSKNKESFKQASWHKGKTTQNFVNLRSQNNNFDRRSMQISESSLFTDLSDTYQVTNKIGDRELYEIFRGTFKRYASTSRHSPEVISRRISLSWMTDAGVVGEILTPKQADDAFKKAAGPKITLNCKEYKEFLIILTMRLKLPFHEIYKRMCGFEV